MLFPYILDNRQLNKRLEIANIVVKDDYIFQEREALRNKKTTSRIDKRLSDFFRYTPKFSTKFHNFLYRSGFFLYAKLFFLLLLFIIVLTYLIFAPLYGVLASRTFILSVSMGILIFLVFLKWRENVWLKNILKQFPEALDIINRCLKSGLPLKRGISLVAEEMSDPIGGEFKYMEAQLQIGVSSRKTLTEASERITIEDFRLFAIALLLQQEMGGSLSDILLKLHNVLSEREKIRSKISILSTEAKTSAWIVSSLPFIIAVILEYLNPSYLRFFIDDPTGNIMLGMICILTVLATISIHRMTSFIKE
jgi:tight adherence protein B